MLGQSVTLGTLLPRQPRARPVLRDPEAILLGPQIMADLSAMVRELEKSVEALRADVDALRV